MSRLCFEYLGGNVVFRPWGTIDWSLALTGTRSWCFVGAIGTEERSLAAWLYLQDARLLAQQFVLDIHDVDSVKYRSMNASAMQDRRDEFTTKGGNVGSIRSFDLMSEDFRILELAKALESSGNSVVLDVSSLPKRFFFPILRSLVRSPAVRDLLVTYTIPDSYVEDSPLYEDIEPWRVLPGFGGLGAKPETWVVSVGFLVESLRSYVTDNPALTMQVLIPFPAPFGTLRRMWHSVASLEQQHDPTRFAKFRVDASDLSAAFDRIRSLVEKPLKSVAFAPFGPKPLSAAMCLYAMQRDSSVHYPQPTVYHPQYSKGIRDNDPSRAVTAYWIKHDGEFLYRL